ncbi:response regulator [Pseudodesulfovibrio cashew]|uniref:Response regulator n=1 Tax=Pseudodesulfovibrio cashew TaxID=2678688 RepID=A0A6I6JH05_9BACT|nr:response regulator [Pseudodesulfovibrio cashew]QGY40300.1 response regulator [Pseudodesulfovibrio cashew]
MTIKGKILVIDDEERFRTTLARLLRNEGCTVEEAADGLDAVNKLAAGSYDVVLLDMRMPGFSGREVFEEIRTQGFDVETICLTGHASIKGATQLLRDGVFDYLLKPASMEEIIQAIRRALERKRLRHGEIGVTQLIQESGT